MKPASDLIYVRVLRNGYIPQLGICGPIPNPIQITRGKAYSMINDGIEVHEFDPKTKETTKLTVKNVFGDGASAPAPEVKVEEKKAVEPAKAEEKKAEPEKPVTLTGVAKPEEKKEEAPAPKAEEVKPEEKKAEPVEEVKADEKAETSEVKADNKKENTTNNTGKKNK